MDATQHINKKQTLLHNYLQQKSNVGWLLGTVAIALLISIPIFTVLSSIFLPGSDVWLHLKATVLTSYIKNSILLALGVGIGTMIHWYQHCMVMQYVRISWT